MIFVLGGTVLACVSAVFLFRYSERGYAARHLLSSIAGVLCSILSLIGCAILVFSGYFWVGAEHKAQIINREYGTNYTRSEVFFAEDVIDTIRHLDRQRVEINGNILRDGEGR